MALAPSTIWKAIGAVKDQTSIGIAKVASNMAPDLEVAIVKATSHEDEPAGEKYIREILQLTSYSRGCVHACVSAVSKRLDRGAQGVDAGAPPHERRRPCLPGRDPVFRTFVLIQILLRIYVEYQTLRDTSSFHFDYVIFGTNSFCAFALNLAVFLLVGKTSALTMNVAGVVKDWLLIAFSWSVIKDTVTPINLVGYGLAFLGVAYYNHSKLQALKAKEAQKKVPPADEEANNRLLEAEGEGREGK